MYPFPKQALWETSLLKTLWEKEKLLVTSNFSFSHSIFYPFGEHSAIFIEFEIVVCKLVQFGGLKFVVWERETAYGVVLLRFGEVLTLNSLSNVKFLDWSKFKAFADDRINVTETLNFVSGRVENIVGKGENALLFLLCF